MSVARVPQTWELTGDDARRTLRDNGSTTLVKDAWSRLREADGFSHARSLAFTALLVMIQGTIAVVGLAELIGSGQAHEVIVGTLQALAPGPAGNFLTEAAQQAQRASDHGRYLGLVLGLGGALVAGTTAVGQVERALNRMYGIDRDRPTTIKYARAFALAASMGALFTVGFVALALGRPLGRSLTDTAWATAWSIVRAPLALVVFIVGIALLFQWAPHRRQPSISWLAYGSAVSAVLVTIATVLLGGFFIVSPTFGQTYGPLAGVLAVAVWSLLVSISFLFGGALAAQLEDVRARRTWPDGLPAPQAVSVSS